MDHSTQIIAAVTAAHENHSQLSISGSGSKRDWLPSTGDSELLSVGEHAGIEDYQPTELVITARAGTSIKEIEQYLARERQMFAFEPPQYYGQGTFGGAVACGYSGPNRPWGGALRDAVLGVELVNGRGERLTFGGQVMKNVAGYDISRLQAGAYGCLGVLLTISMRVQPMWESCTTLRLQCDAQDSQQTARALAQRAVPVTATCWVDGELYIRLAGDTAAVARSQRNIGGDVDTQPGLWEKVRDHQHEFFKAMTLARHRDEQSLWRVSAPPAAALPQCPAEDLLIEWAGGLRWLWHDDAAFVTAYAKSIGGWAWRRGDALLVEPQQRNYMAAIKQAFDPQNVFVSPLDFAHAD